MLCFVDEKLQKLQSGWGSAPDPDGGAYSAPPYPLAGREGATPPPAPTPALNQFHLIAFPNPPVSRPAYGPVSIGVERTWAAVGHRWDYTRNFSLQQRYPSTHYPFACSPPSFTDGLCLVLKRTVFGLSRTTAHLFSHN